MTCVQRAGWWLRSRSLGTGRGVGFRQAYELANRIQYDDHRAIDDAPARAKSAPKEEIPNGT